MEPFELKTKGGFRIKVTPNSLTCVVMRGDRSEMSQAAKGQSLEQPIPSVLFLGGNFEMMVQTGEITLVPNRSFRLQIPYYFHPDSDSKTLQISCHSYSDQFPILLNYFETVREFLKKERELGRGHYLVILVQSGLPSIEMIALKTKYPATKIMILKRFEEEAKDITHRATDQSKSYGGDASANPVFLARIHLRNLELDKVRQILWDYDMKAEEIQFIQTFLQIMIKNEHQKQELFNSKQELQRLDELYRLSALILEDNKVEFDKELDRGIDPRIARWVVPLVTRCRMNAKLKEDEITLWEWEYRLNQMSHETAQ